MRNVYFALALVTWCGSGELSKSSESFLVRPGQNVTLPCSIRFKHKIVWLSQSSEEMIALTTIIKGNVGNRTMTVYHSDDNGHFETQEDNHRKSFSLKITGVTESDLGLYYCVALDSDEVRFGKGIRLIFPGSGKHSLSCWTLLVFLPPAVAVATALCVCGLFHRRVRSPATCSNRVSNNDIIKEENLHYASLHLPNKPKKSRQRETPPLSGDITYASVALQPPTNQNC
ncbi:uncharacterized protein LOC118232976 isoform X1 [Anguilla anguilla]|uniref:uncharacterized protein LOC118232976 isoform X1 n=2 Tax=Anguilla anguilla TaxID=7936 RepID=UPI0015B27083|nr:uncharacterized protein LOC118232976 isoform X1 [Anguilla anguilla]